MILKGSGWNEASVKPGDRVDVKGLRARNGSRQLWSETMTVAGKPVFTLKDLKPATPARSEPAPRGSDGKVILGSAEGYWGFPSEHALVEDGVNVPMDRYGQLTELGDAAKVAPMQPWALALYAHRQERSLQDDPMFINCKPPGGPRQYQSDLGIKFVEDKVNERIFILMGSGNRNYRIIYMDGREKVGSVTGDDDNPLYYGRAHQGLQRRLLVDQRRIAAHEQAGTHRTFYPFRHEYAAIPGNSYRRRCLHASLECELDHAVGSRSGSTDVLLSGQPSMMSQMTSSTAGHCQVQKSGVVR